MEGATGAAAGWTQFVQLDHLLFKLAAFLAAITLHDVLQAWLAVRFGDRSPRERGRLTWNPLAHLDPLGLVMLLFGPYGWSRKLTIDREALGNRPAWKLAVVYGSGPALHLALGLLFWWLSFRIPFSAPSDWSLAVEGPYSALQSWPDWIVSLLQGFVYWSFIVHLMLFIIHCFPLHPTDVWKAAASVLGDRFPAFLSPQAERWTTVLLVAVMATPIGRLLLETLFQWCSSAVMHLF